MPRSGNTKLLDLFEVLEAEKTKRGVESEIVKHLCNLIEAAHSDRALLDVLHRRVKLEGGFNPTDRARFLS